MAAAKTVDQFLSALPDDRRRVVSSLRTLILTHLEDTGRKSARKSKAKKRA